MIETAEAKPAKLLNMTIADFLQKEERSSEMLKALGISVRGNEDKTLMEVCTSQQKNEDEVLKEINKFKKRAEFEYPAGLFSWSPELVVKYLEEEHHDYTRLLLQDAEDFGQRALDVHGTQYSELNQIRWYVEKLAEKLEFHLRFEEEKFFPKILKFFSSNSEPKDGTVQSLKKQIKLIQKEQNEIEYFIKRIRKLTNEFTPPEEACTTFCLFYHTLQKLDNDLQKHHFVEEQFILSKLEQKLEAVLT